MGKIKEIRVKELYRDDFIEYYKSEYDDLKYDDEIGQYKFESVGLIMNSWNNKIKLNRDIFYWCGHNERIMQNLIDFIKNTEHYLETTIVEKEDDEDE